MTFLIPHHHNYRLIGLLYIFQAKYRTKCSQDRVAIIHFVSFNLSVTLSPISATLKYHHFYSDVTPLILLCSHAIVMYDTLYHIK